MIIQKNVDLGKKTTFRIGGNASNFFIPETEKELIEVTSKIYKEEKRINIIAGGSNLLINDEKEFDSVVSIQKACLEMIYRENGLFYIGASNRMQSVIQFVNKYNYGGFEELVGLPVLFGGVVYMNAGIGSKEKTFFTISDFIVSVRALDLEQGMVVELSNEKCEFGHRHSIFFNGKYVILGALIKMNYRTVEEARQRILSRKLYCKTNFEWGKGCFGTCFSTSNPKILKGCAVMKNLNGGGILCQEQF